MDHDPDNQNKSGSSMNNGSEANDLDRKIDREIPSPDHNAACKQRQQTNDHREKQQLLPCIVLTNGGQFFFTIVKHVVNLTHPLEVALVQIVVMPETQRKNQ